MSTLSHQKLIIEVGLQHFAFVITNEINHQIIHFKNFSINDLAPIEPQLTQIFQQEEILQATYQDIVVLHNNTMQTLVPEDMFDETALGSYLQYTTKIYASDYFDFDEISSQKCKNVYVPYIHYNNFLLDQFGSFTFQHFGSAVIHYMTEKNEGKEHDVSILIQNNLLHVVVLKNKKLIFYNTFEHQTKEDFLYYTLFVFEQLRLDPNQIPVTLIGCIDEKDAYYEIIYKYIRYVKVMDHDKIASTLSLLKTQVQSYFILLHS